MAARDSGAPIHLVFMGVSGTGKSAVGKPVAEQLGCVFAEGDDFHPLANIDKMSGGTPLTDEDRWPWLRAIAAWVDASRATGRPSRSRRCLGRSSSGGSATAGTCKNHGS